MKRHSEMTNGGKPVPVMCFFYFKTCPEETGDENSHRRIIFFFLVSTEAPRLVFNASRKLRYSWNQMQGSKLRPLCYRMPPAPICARKNLMRSHSVGACFKAPTGTHSEGTPILCPFVRLHTEGGTCAGLNLSCINLMNEFSDVYFAAALEKTKLMDTPKLCIASVAFPWALNGAFKDYMSFSRIIGAFILKHFVPQTPCKCWNIIVSMEGTQVHPQPKWPDTKSLQELKVHSIFSLLVFQEYQEFCHSSSAAWEHPGPCPDCGWRTGRSWPRPPSVSFPSRRDGFRYPSLSAAPALPRPAKEKRPLRYVFLSLHTVKQTLITIDSPSWILSPSSVCWLPVL